jgi:hypothetical protein
VQTNRRLRPWVDPSSSRPLVLLVVISFAIFLGPLVIDVFKAIFFRIPWNYRWVLGQGALVALLGAGLCRLWLVRPTDSWPAAATALAPASSGMLDNWVPWALRAAVISLALPLASHPEGMGFADWDYYCENYEALRRTVLEWGQFPWWNPWTRGGFPLAANPLVSPISIAAPLVLLLGTTPGLALAVVACLFLAVEGGYRLARLWLGEPWAASVVALVYGLNGGVIIHGAQNYSLVMTYCSLPWLAYYAYRIGERPSAGLWLGFWLAFVVLNGIEYLSLYGGVLMAVIWIRSLRVQRPGRRMRLLANTVAAAGLCLTLCGWRLATTLLVVQGDKRERVTYWDESVFSIPNYLLARPPVNWYEILPGQHHADYISLVSYVGPVVVMLGLVSLLYGWKWWHTLTLCCTWLAIGSVRWYHPSLWLIDWPLFASTHVVTRWRYVAILGLGLAAGSVLARWRRSNRRAVRLAAAGLALVIAVDLIWLGHQQFPLAFSVPRSPGLFPGPPVSTIVNVKDGLGYPCILRGYGVIRGYEPMLSYRRDAPTLRKAREDPDYRGESWTGRGLVVPVYWSPNRLIFQVEPGAEVTINENPGSWWQVNGQEGFPGHRCAELLVPFVARADAAGRLDLRISPRGLALGIGLQIAGVGLLAVAGLYRIRRACAAPGPDLLPTGRQPEGEPPWPTSPTAS